MKGMKGAIAGASIAVVLLIILGVLIGSYSNLVTVNQGYKGSEARYGAALDLCSQKIEAVWSVFNEYLGQERVIFDKAMNARKSFYEAAARGDAKATVDSALAFNVVAVQEAYPVLSSVPVAQQTIRSMEESINEIKTALDDWIYATQTYNVTRQKPMGMLVGAMIPQMFPLEQDYYKSEKVRLDISNIKLDAATPQ